MLLTTVSPAVGSVEAAVESADQTAIPTRPYGKSGIRVPILAFGANFDTLSNQLLLRQALKLGVTYWETAEAYSGGRCEQGFGKYFTKHPADRQKVFLVTKTAAREPAAMTAALEGSLKRLNTSYVDLYLWHKLPEVNSFYNTSIRDWVAEMKRTGKIRLFGISTHRNMEDIMLAAAAAGGIDGIQMTYNFRIMQTERMQKAVDACVNAGMGLTAMKTQGGRSARSPAPELMEKELDLLSQASGNFLEKGLTDNQARLIAVWKNPHIASICSRMPSMTILKSNVDAALNREKLSQNDLAPFEHYASMTASGYCAGCGFICESAVNGNIPIASVMRYLMYFRSYGDRDRAQTLFNNLSREVRRRLADTDYAAAERKCPQRMAIGRLMTEAVQEFA